MTEKNKKPPVSITIVNRMLVVLIVLLTILAGYFHARMSNELRITQRLLSKYQSCMQQLNVSENIPDQDIPIEGV